MANPTFYDLIRVNISTTGTGSTLTIAGAVAGWLAFTGVPNGTTIPYGIIDGNNTETGTLVYNSGSNTLGARTVSASTNSNAPINLSGNAVLAVTFNAEQAFVTLGGSTIGLGSSAPVITGNFGIGGVGTTPDSLLTLNANTAATSIAPPAGTLLHLVGGASNANAFIQIDTFGTGTPTYFTRAAGGTIGALTRVASGASLFQLQGQGYDGTSYGVGPLIITAAQENWSSGAHGAYMSFYTTPVTTTSFTEHMRLWGSGAISVGTITTDPGFPGFNSAMTVSGSFSNQQIYNEFIVTDSASIGSASFGIGLFVGINFGGSTVNGGREAIVGTVNLTSATNASNPNRNYVGVTGVGQTSVSDNGLGAFFGLGGLGGLLTPASGSYVVVNVTGLESDVFCQANTSAGFKSCAQFSGEVRDRVAGTTVDAMLWCLNQDFVGSGHAPGWANGLLFSDDSANQHYWPFTSASTLIKAGSSASPLGTGIDLSGCAVTTPFISRQLTVTTSGGLDLVEFGNWSHPTQVFFAGNGTGANGGVQMLIQAGFGASAILLGNYSGVWGTDHTGAANFDLMGVLATTSDLAIMPPHWAYFSGFSTTDFNTAGTAPTHPSGLAIGWNYLNNSPTGGETDFVNNIGGKNGPWDFVFQDWNGTSLTNLAYINQGGGLYIPSTKSQTTVGGGYGTGAPGTLPTPGVAGSADNFMAVGLFNSDSTARTVPYNTSGVLLGNAMNSTLFVGNTSAGTSDPTPQGSTQALLVSSWKSGAAAGTASVYGQTGGMILNVTGGWAGTSGTTFAQSVTLVSSQKTYTLSTPATNYHFTVGMPVVSSGSPGALPASTVIVSVSGNTITLNNAPTTPGACTLTFWAGTPVTTPATATPTVPNGAYNPFAGTPGDTFAINGQANLYDNGYGVAEFLEYVISTYNLTGTLNIQQRLTAGITTSGQLNVFGSVGVHATGWQAVATAGTNIGFGVYIANSSGSWSFWGATSGGNGFSMSTLGVSAISDPSIKQDIRKFGSVKSTVMSLDPVGYRYHPEMRKHGGIDRDKEFLGFLSRDHGELRGVESAMRGSFDGILVRDMGSPMGTFNGYCRDEMLPILWRGVQELWGDVDQVLDRMNGMEARVTALEGRLQ